MNNGQMDRVVMKIQPSICLDDWGKPRKNPVRLVGTGIRTRDLPNACLVRFHGATSLGGFNLGRRHCVFNCTGTLLFVSECEYVVKHYWSILNDRNFVFNCAGTLLFVSGWNAEEQWIEHMVRVIRLTCHELTQINWLLSGQWFQFKTPHIHTPTTCMILRWPFVICSIIHNNLQTTEEENTVSLHRKRFSFIKETLSLSVIQKQM